MIALLGALSALSCGDNTAIEIRYTAEKKLHNADREVRKARETGRQMTPAEALRISPLYRDVTRFCSVYLDSLDTAKNPVEYNEVRYLAFESSLKLSELFAAAGLQDSSANNLNRLLQSVPLTDKQSLAVYLKLGRTYQSRGAWDSALVAYSRVIEDYYPPVDDAGEIITGAFKLPIKLYQTLHLLGDSAAASREFFRAEQYYRKIIADNPDTRLAAAAHAGLADLYEEAGRWEQQLVELQILADRTRPGYREVMTRIADIYAGPLRRSDTALGLYRNLLDNLGAEDSTGAPILLVRMSLAQMAGRRYAECREMILRLKTEYPKFFDSTPMPQYAFARSYEREGNWTRAEAEYNLLIQKYRGSDEALTAILRVLDALKAQGRKEEALAWYHEARQYIAETISLRPGTVVEARALLYEAELLKRNNQPDSAAAVLVSVFDRFPETEPGRKAAQEAARLHRRLMGSPGVADSLLLHLRRSLARVDLSPQTKDLLAD
ncbi:MAG: tetratricopeptide repeat protein [Candidatus Zixiibacteriota bacterium]|nr:MAG: tetratricopeptide repeat protein [candidate division Zixibacteria bacterium]